MNIFFIKHNNNGRKNCLNVDRNNGFIELNDEEISKYIQHVKDKIREYIGWCWDDDRAIYMKNLFHALIFNQKFKLLLENRKIFEFNNNRFCSKINLTQLPHTFTDEYGIALLKIGMPIHVDLLDEWKTKPECWKLIQQNHASLYENTLQLYDDASLSGDVLQLYDDECIIRGTKVSIIFNRSEDKIGNLMKLFSANQILKYMLENGYSYSFGMYESIYDQTNKQPENLGILEKYYPSAETYLEHIKFLLKSNFTFKILLDVERINMLQVSQLKKIFERGFYEMGPNQRVELEFQHNNENKEKFQVLWKYLEPDWFIQVMERYNINVPKLVPESRTILDDIDKILDSSHGIPKSFLMYPELRTPDNLMKLVSTDGRRLASMTSLLFKPESVIKNLTENTGHDYKKKFLDCLLGRAGQTMQKLNIYDERWMYDDTNIGNLLDLDKLPTGELIKIAKNVEDSETKMKIIKHAFKSNCIVSSITKLTDNLRLTTEEAEKFKDYLLEDITIDHLIKLKVNRKLKL